jgi:integrase
MLFGFARVSAVAGLKVRDYEARSRRAWLVVREKGGQWRRIPVHTKAAEAIDSWIEASGLAGSPEAPLFQGLVGRTGRLTGEPLTRRGALDLIKRRAVAAGLPAALGNHSFRASGITAFLKAGGTVEAAAAIAGRASTRTTQLYDRRRELVEPDDIERIRI